MDRGDGGTGIRGAESGVECAESGVKGAESGVEGAEAGVEGAGSGGRGGGESGKIGAGNCFFYRKFRENDIFRPISHIKVHQGNMHICVNYFVTRST